MGEGSRLWSIMMSHEPWFFCWIDPEGRSGGIEEEDLWPGFSTRMREEVERTN